LDVPITNVFPTFPSAGKTYIVALSREKQCERTKTVGIVKTAPLPGFDGRFGLGGPRAETWAAF
jgi:hypothetical protein